MLFFCPLARVVWFASPLALRVDDLLLHFHQALPAIADGLMQEPLTLCANLLWSIRKTHNKLVFQAESTPPNVIIGQAMAILSPQPSRSRQRVVPQSYCIPQANSFILLDASYQSSGRAGLAVVVYDATEQLHWISIRCTSCTYPLCQQPTIICTDSLTVANVISSEVSESSTHRQAVSTFQECIHLKHQLGGIIKPVHIHREHLARQHNLANYARRTGRTF